VIEGGRLSDIDRPHLFSKNKKIPASSDDEEDDSRVGQIPSSGSEQD
jgi:hypothetical protein